MLTIRDIKRTYPGLLTINPSNLLLVESALQKLWAERQIERGQLQTSDRSGSCKFAALMARQVFGGRLDGNDEHVFVIKNGSLLDINRQQEDVLELGVRAHMSMPWTLEHPDYREALASCLPRVERWIDWIFNQPGIRKSSRHASLHEDLSP